MMRTCFLIPCLLAMALTWAAPAPARGATTEGSLKSYRGIIHVHSNFSTGELSPAEVVAKAKKAGIKIVVFTDHDLVRASWGLPPFRNLLSYTMDFKPSVFQIGVDNYFDTIENLQSENSDMVIIPAIESAPFYYVSGNPIFGEMNIHDWRRHILLIGLGREAVKIYPCFIMA